MSDVETFWNFELSEHYTFFRKKLEKSVNVSLSFMFCCCLCSVKCPNTELFLVGIQSECGKIRTRNNSVFGHFSRSVYLIFFYFGKFIESVSFHAYFFICFSNDCFCFFLVIAFIRLGVSS